MSGLQSHVMRDLQLCPNCGYELTRSTAADGSADAPGPGDVTLCFGCALALRFDERMQLQELTAVDVEQLKARGVWVELTRVRARLRRSILSRPG